MRPEHSGRTGPSDLLALLHGAQPDHVHVVCFGDAQFSLPLQSAPLCGASSARHSKATEEHWILARGRVLRRTGCENLLQLRSHGHLASTLSPFASRTVSLPFARSLPNVCFQPYLVRRDYGMRPKYKGRLTCTVFTLRLSFFSRACSRQTTCRRCYAGRGYKSGRQPECGRRPVSRVDLRQGQGCCRKEGPRGPAEHARGAGAGEGGGGGVLTCSEATSVRYAYLP